MKIKKKERRDEITMISVKIKRNSNNNNDNNDTDDEEDVIHYIFMKC